MQTNSIGIPLPREQGPDWLLPLRNGFLASLLSLGLKTSTVEVYARTIDWFCAEVGRRGLMAPDGVDEAVLVQVRDPLPARLSVPIQRKRASVLDRFIAFLVKENAMAAAPQPPEPVPTALDRIRRGCYMSSPARNRLSP